MSTTISINKQTISDFLRNGAEHQFVIPEYQRPYAWGIDQIQTLFEDIWDFTLNSGGSKRPNEKYFLGSIVSYENDDNKEQEIIDGQQRITSLFLLLRAIYTKLSEMEVKTLEAKNFIEKIAPTIWRADKLTGQINYSDILIESRVISSEDNEILRKILETGHADEKAKDNYSRNYILLEKLYSEHSAQEPLVVYDFIYAILNQAIVLPITADTQDTALTIFSTLNNRGLPLSDADIFKAKIYNHLSEDEKKSFIANWQDLTEESERAGESIQNLFYYYMFYLRACQNDKDTTTPGVRKYYSSEKFKRLYADDLMDNLGTIVNLLKVMNKRIHNELEEEWIKDIRILQALDVLYFYPNEFGKYPVIIFYLSHHKKANFMEAFRVFLRKLLREIIVKYVLVPSVSAVKGDILNLNAKIVKSYHPDFEFKNQDESNLHDALKTPHYKTVRMLLGILAYDEQDSLLPNNPIWEIEHIFPQKWQQNFFPTESPEKVREKIENIGNKMPFEKKLNITAGNGYFDKKKEEYKKSHISMAQKMSQCQTHNWDLENISERNIRLADRLVEIFKLWVDEYTLFSSPEKVTNDLTPSPEEQALIDKFRKNGWV